MAEFELPRAAACIKFCVQRVSLASAHILLLSAPSTLTHPPSRAYPEGYPRHPIPARCPTTRSTPPAPGSGRPFRPRPSTPAVSPSSKVPLSQSCTYSSSGTLSTLQGVLAQAPPQHHKPGRDYRHLRGRHLPPRLPDRDRATASADSAAHTPSSSSTRATRRSCWRAP